VWFWFHVVVVERKKMREPIDDTDYESDIQEVDEASSVESNADPNTKYDVAEYIAPGKAYLIAAGFGDEQLIEKVKEKVKYDRNRWLPLSETRIDEESGKSYITFTFLNDTTNYKDRTLISHIAAR
jgi:hypothetical protein